MTEQTDLFTPDARATKLVDTQATITWQYLAGFFDGKGCIQTGICKRFTLARGKTMYRGIRVSITNTHFTTLNLIDEFLKSEGIIGSLTIKPTTGNRKICWNWRIGNKAGATAFLNALLPYLITKKEQALRALDFIRNSSPRKGIKLSPETRYKMSLGAKQRWENARKLIYS